MYKLITAFVFSCLILTAGFAAFAADDYWTSTLGPYQSGDTRAYTYVILGASRTITGEGIPTSSADTAAVLIWEATNWYYQDRVWDAGNDRTASHNSTTINIAQAGGTGSPYAKSCTKTFWIEGKPGVRSATAGISTLVGWATLPFKYVRGVAPSIENATTSGVSTYGSYTADIRGYSWIRLRCSGAAITSGSTIVQLAVQ